MTHVNTHIRSLLGAKDITRAIGLMVVLVFVTAVGGVSLVSFLNQRATVRVQRTAALSDALQLLSDRLVPAPVDGAGKWQVVINQFAARYPCDALRLYDAQGQVLASLNAAEVGHAKPVIAGGLTGQPNGIQTRWMTGIDGQVRYLVARTPVHSSGVPEARYLEAVFAPEVDGFGIGKMVWALAIALVASAALLVVQRRLRCDLASVTRIAATLVRHDDGFADQLPEMRIAHGDRIAECWNRFVDHACALDEEVARSTASSELLAVLSRSDAGELADAMTAAPLGVILAAQPGDVLYANAMARRLVGWPRDDAALLSLRDGEFSTDGSRIIECITQATSSSGRATRAVDAQVEGEEDSFYHVQVVPARTSQQSSRVLALILDVSQQVRADKAREEFVSQVTHELRTPLTNIRAYAETLSSGMFDDPKVITECYNVITKETRRLSRLIEDILSISQLEVGTMQLVMDDVDFRELLNEAVQDVRGIAESKNIDLQLTLPPKLDRVRADRDKLAVVANNLLGNALKYTPEGGQVTVTCKAAGAQVQIAVRDTGIGIAAADHGRIFEKFQRANDEAVLAETGTGIGLTTAREIIQQHGGEITVVSKKGEGATFTVVLPLAKSVSSVAEPVAV